MFLPLSMNTALLEYGRGWDGVGVVRKSLEKAGFCITEDSGSLGFSSSEGRISGAVKRDDLFIFTG